MKSPRNIDSKQLKALIVYFSATGNTKKVAQAILNTLKRERVRTTFLQVKEAAKEELYDYDLVFLGSPSINWLPAEPVVQFIKEKFKLHRERGDVKLGAPKIPGKSAIVFCTYSGPHTGVNEAVPTVKYMGQFLEHLGFEIAGEWCVIGEFHGNEPASTVGKLGDIRGRPNEQDLMKVENDVVRLLKSGLGV